MSCKRIAAVAFLLMSLCRGSLAQGPAAPPRVVNDNDVVQLPGNVPPQVAAAQDIGPTNVGLAMQRMILVVLPRAGAQAELDALVAQQHDPHSPQFQQWLTPVQFGARFGVSDDDLNAIRQWLLSHGFTIDEVAASRTWINFSGTVGEVEQAFHTQIHDFALNGESHHANVASPSIPRGLSDIVAGIVSLHDFRKAGMHTQPQLTASNGAHFLAPADFATIYNVNTLYGAGIDGTGQTVAIVGRTNIHLSDVQAFRSFFGLPAKNPTITLNGTDPGIVNTNEETEADLDVEWSGAVAKNATVNFVVSASTQTTDGVDLSAQYIVNNNLAPVMSTSFGLCEQSLGSSGNTFYDNLWQQAASQGITAFISSGDSGAAGCDSGSSTKAHNGLAVNGLCSSPYSVCVGGTQFNDTANPGQYWSATNDPTTKKSVLGVIPEIAWNESGAVSGGSGLWSTGGGVSTIYTKPSWQVAPGVPSDGKRDVPDVSLSAASHDGYAVCQADVGGTCSSGSFVGVGGTSASSPSFAGLMALVVQKVGFRQGNANTIFYPMANSQYGSGGTAVFRDITSGSNMVPSFPSGTIGYNTTAGYDPVTGLGSVDAAVMVNNWGGATSPDFGISALPASVTIQQGSSGPSTITTTVIGGFNAAVALSASGLPTGVTVGFSPSSISAPGSGSSTMTITVGSGAATGTSSITVTGTSGAFTHSTSVSLTVVPPPDFSLSANPTSVTVAQGGSNTTSITSAIVGTFNAAVGLSASGLPSGVTVAFNPTSIAAPGSGSSVATISAAGNATLGNATITVTGTGGGKTHNTSVSLNVTTAVSLNPIPRTGWALLSVDSQATDCGNYGAQNAYDGSSTTFWLTEFCTASPPPPHDLKIDLGAIYNISGFQYLPRQDGPYGNINQYQFYVSSDGTNWGTPVVSGALITQPTDFLQKQIVFSPVTGRYVWLRALSEVNGNPWTAVAELNVLGSLASGGGPVVNLVSANPTTIAGGSTSLGTVTLSAAAPSGGALVSLSSSNTFAATVPPNVTVLAGQTTANFTISTFNVTANTPVTIGASYNGASVTTPVTVNTGGAGSSPIAHTGWVVLSVDSQATNCGNYAAQNAFDGNSTTYWLTEFCNGSPPTPHDLKIDLGASYTINGFQYLPRQDGPYGNIAQYQFYVSADGINWGSAVANGYLITSGSDMTQKQVTFGSVTGRYVWLRALSEVNGNPWTAVAELNVLGTPASGGGPVVNLVSANPTTIAGGNTSQGTVTLSAAAPSGGALVSLSSSNTFAATVPPNVTVLAGQTTANFTISTFNVTANTPVTIGASYNGAAVTTPVTVNTGGAGSSPIAHTGWVVLSVDSQATDCGNYAAQNAFDGNSTTIWLTEFCTGSPAPPHDLKIDMGGSYTINGFQYLPRQDGPYGNVAQYQFYVSTDGVNWGSAVATGYLITSGSDMTQKQVTFGSVTGRYVWLRALSEVNGNPWTAVAELNVLGTPASGGGPVVNLVSANPTTIAGGSTSQGTVTLSAAAPTGGALVSLSSSNTFAATVPPNVTVLAGQTTANFTISTFNVTANTPVTIGASYNGAAVTTPVTVNTGGAGSSPIAHTGWVVLSVDSQATDCGNYAAQNAFDGNSTTIWLTEFCTGSPAPPHDLKIDMGGSYTINGFQYLPRQDGPYGNVAQYQFYVSTDGVNWGSAVATGYLITSGSDMTQKQVTFGAVTGRYVWLRALSEVNGGPWTAVAELNVLGN